MAKMSIFIGSATEDKEAAATIARALADNGYKPRRWWEDFPAGSITLDRLLEIAKKVDGAVFLFTGVDKTWYREKVSGTPRDNVILEYGIFVAQLGRERTIVLKDPRARLPSDIAPITYGKIVEDISTVAEKTVQHFDQLFSDPLAPPIKEISLVADPELVDQQLRNPPPDAWHNRDLYFGIEGAKGWLATVNDPNYYVQPQEIRLRKLLLEAVDQISARTFVSLGPGDASGDREIAIKLRSREPWLQYIPVDISDGLLQRTVGVLSKEVRVPVGILGDFEDRLNFIFWQLRVYAVHPILFALLGNTMGDLDRYEESLLRTLRDFIDRSDYLLLDVSLVGPRWSRDSDRRFNHTSYGPGYRQFIASGVTRRTGESAESIMAKFEERIRFDEGYSDVANARTVNLVDTRSNRLVCTLRRYQWDSLLEWLERKMHFKILFKASTFMEDGILGDGVVLLGRR